MLDLPPLGAALRQGSACCCRGACSKSTLQPCIPATSSTCLVRHAGVDKRCFVTCWTPAVGVYRWCYGCFIQHSCNTSGGSLPTRQLHALWATKQQMLNCVYQVRTHAGCTAAWLMCCRQPATHSISFSFLASTFALSGLLCGTSQQYSLPCLRALPRACRHTQHKHRTLAGLLDLGFEPVVFNIYLTQLVRQQHECS